MVVGTVGTLAAVELRAFARQIVERMELQLELAVGFGAVLRQSMKYWVMRAIRIHTYFRGVINTVFVVGPPAAVVVIVIELTVVRVAAELISVFTFNHLET